MPMPGSYWGPGYVTQWQKVFAWWPVKTIDGKRVWLSKVWRRYFTPSTPALPYRMTQYITEQGLIEGRLRGDY